MEFTNPLVYGVPCFFASILLELALSRHAGHHHVYQWKDLAASSFLGTVAAVIGALIKIFVTVALFEWVYEACNPIIDGVRTNFLGYHSFGFAWYIWLLCQFADDLTYYWVHRANHEVRLLWAAHVVHHSSEHYNFGTAVRTGWLTVIYKSLFYAWIPAIGFPPEMVLVCLGIETLYQFVLHTGYIPRIGLLEKVLNTPTMHRVHHAQNVEYLDKNHGGCLNLCDRLFGSFKEMDYSIEMRYGVMHPPRSHHPMEILLHEFRAIVSDVRKAKKFSHGLMYIFGPPGWSPDGSTLTVRQLQRAFQQGQGNPQAQQAKQPESASIGIG